MRFGDIESLHGVSSTTVRTPVDGGQCGIGFRVGVRYVVDASRGADGLSTSACSLTDVADRAVERKQFIRGLRRPGPGGHVSGTVVRWDTGFAPQLLARLAVSLDGPGRVVTTGAADGTFRLEKMRAGAYRLAVVPTPRSGSRTRPLAGTHETVTTAELRATSSGACPNCRLPGH